MRKLLLSILLAGTLAGCVVYDDGYAPGPPAYGYYDAPHYRYYGFHHDHDCWHCDRW
jgi:hypothetical protein